MRTWSRFMLVVAALVLPLLAACGKAAPAASGDQVAAFELALFDGGAMRTQDLLGKVVVVNFFASWCIPCREEAPDLRQTWQIYHDREVAFFGIDVRDDDPGYARTFAQELSLPYPSGQDAGGGIADRFKLVGLPNTFVLGKDGRLAHRFVGPVKQERLATVIEQVLAGG